MSRMPRIIARLAATALCGCLALASAPASAVHFTYGDVATLGEDLALNDIAVIGKLVQRPTNVAADSPPEEHEGTFEVVTALKGEVRLAGQPGANKPYRVKVLYFGEKPLGTQFLLFGIEAKGGVVYGTPVPLSEAALPYVRRLSTLPKSGAERLSFFQVYFEHADLMLAQDAYDEFAAASYADLTALKDRMPHDQLRTWIQSKSVVASRKRLYLYMLSVCGTAADVPLLETLLREEDKDTRAFLDATVACYLTLKGTDGLASIEERFLKNPNSELNQVYAAIVGLRFVGQESKTIPRERLTEAMRHVLEQPKLADIVIPDLTRWEDWSVVNKLVHLFVTSDPESWVRVPVLNYLRACPLAQAKAKLEELEKLDPAAAQRAKPFPVVPAVPAAGGARLIARRHPGFC